MLRPLPLIALALLVTAAPARADTIKVPADFSTIQAAVTAAEDGDVVVVSPGVYDEQVVIFTPGITLRGKKAVIDAGYEGPCLRVAAENVTVTGMVLVNCTVGLGDDFTEGGSPPDGLLVSRCTIRACGTGMEFTAQEVVVERCVIEDCEDYGLDLIAVNGADTLVLSRNTVENCGRDGMRLRAAAVELDRNQVRRCFDSGIDLELETPFEGGQLPSTLRGNRVEACLGIGLRMVNPFGFPTTVVGNKLNENGRGLTLVGQGFTVRDNECSRNTENGMLLGDESDDHFAVSTVEDNDVRDNGRFGIVITGPLLCRIDPATPNRFVDNEVRGNGHDGVTIDHAHDDEFVDNVVSTNGGDGIDIAGGLFDLLLDGNRFLKNEHEGVDNSGSGTRLQGNRIKGNARGVGPDLAGTGDEGAGSAVDLGGNKIDTGGFDVPARLDREVLDA